MDRRALERASLVELIEMAKPLLRQAEQACPRTGRGRRPTIPDWVLGALIMVGVLKRRKSKSAQYRFLDQHRDDLQASLGIDKLPARSTFFDRYRRAHRLFQIAIRIQGEQALREQAADATCVAVDKSLVSARGPAWHKNQRNAGFVPCGVDIDSTWSYSEHHGWVQGYGFEVVVTAAHRGVCFPLLASVDQAHVREHRSFEPKIEELPRQTRFVLLDMGYDSNALAEAVEWDSTGRRTHRFYLCPPAAPKRVSSRKWRQTRERALHRRRRDVRRSRLQQPRFRRLYARRGKTIEPFNDHFKRLFDMHDSTWHRGLDNNRTHILAALFSYQLLVRYNHRRKRKHAQIQWILDGL